MKISTPDGILDIPEDLDFEIKASHPFFSDEGSASIPVTVPATTINCALLGYPERVDRRTRYEKESSAIAECGAWRKQCKVITESAGRDSGIALCLALAESDMYAQVRDRKLKDIFAEHAHAPSRMTLCTPMDAFRAIHLEGFSYSGIEFPFALFPVAVDFDGQGSIVVLNQPATELSLPTDNWQGADRILSAPRTITAGERSLTVPTGYGVAPYMYLWFMIEEAFRLSGFGIGANCFKTDEDLKKIVVVHNKADVSVNMCGTAGDMWGFYYADLVPDMTLGDLISWLRDKFGAVIRNDSGGIYIYLMRDLLTGDPDYDLTPIAAADETLSYPDPSTIEREMDTSIKYAEPAAESLEQLREKFTNCTEVSDVSAIAGTGLFHVTPLGKYYYKQAGEDAVLLGSSTFPYKRKSDLKAENLSTDDCFLPSIYRNGRIMPFLGKIAHAYLETDESKEEQPLQICYAHDVLQNDGSYLMCGSSFSYDFTGKEITKRIRRPSGAIALVPHPALTPEGLAPLWEGYEKMLMNGAPEISLECEFPMADLVSINLITPKLFKGAHVLITEITYKVLNAATTRAKLSLQLIPSYDGMTSPAPIYFNRNIGWKLVSTRTLFPGGDYTVESTDGLADYTMDDAPQYTPKTSGVVTKKRSRWVRYKHKFWTVKWYMISYTVETVTHKWDEYFISEATE